MLIFVRKGSLFRCSISLPKIFHTSVKIWDTETGKVELSSLHFNSTSAAFVSLAFTLNLFFECHCEGFYQDII
ncbi:CMF_collapsed_G0013430.mRNA.1.CDS.1 [Saccharomyces cerevisiae]|nr:CMF_collapsed_G0013430.mRNA.1.CDS.1 [Saccharomyces cerevisiae]